MKKYVIVKAASGIPRYRVIANRKKDVARFGGAMIKPSSAATANRIAIEWNHNK